MSAGIIHLHIFMTLCSYYVSPVEVTSFERMDKSLTRGYICRNGDIMHIAETQQRHFVGLVSLGAQRIAEEEKDIYLIA